MIKKLMTVLLVLSLLSMPVACAKETALTPTSTPTPTGWTTFTTDDGLASNRVASVIQDNQGILWVGSDQGLTRFDGNNWGIYTDSLVNTHIICAARDKQGNLWFGTASDAAYKYTGEEWQNIIPAISDLRPNVTVQDILVDIQGDIWFAVTGNRGKRTAPMDHGVTRYNGSDFWINFLGRTHVTTIFQDNQGNLWFGSNVGVTRYDGADWRTFTEEDGLADNYVVAITEDSEGNMRFGTWNDGTSCYDGKEWRTFNPEDGLETSAVHCMLTDSRGNLWFGSYCIDGYYGISRYDGTQWQHFDPWPDTNKYNVISIFEDNEGNIWFATSIGLVRYNPGLPESSPGEETKVEPAPESQISRERAIELATDMLKGPVAAVVARGNVRAELHGWYWEVTFDNINAEAEELMPFPLRSPPPGGSASEAYPGIYQSVVITVDAETGDPLSAGASKEPRPGPYVSREQAISSARERITSGISETWLERAMVEAYLRGDTWIVLFWEEGASIEDSSSGLSVNRFRVSVDAVTGEAEGLRRG
jgi:hypothetical protein